MKKLISMALLALTFLFSGCDSSISEMDIAELSNYSSVDLIYKSYFKRAFIFHRDFKISSL